MAKPLQVYLDDAELERLEAFARDRGWTKSQAIRAAIRALTRQSENEAVLELSGDIDGLPSNLSREFDRYLNQTYVAKAAGTYRGRRRKSNPVRR